MSNGIFHEKDLTRYYHKMPHADTNRCGMWACAAAGVVWVMGLAVAVKFILGV